MKKPVLDPILTTREILGIEKFSRTTLWRKVKAGTYPKPVKITATSNGFFQSAVARRRAAIRAAAGLPEDNESTE
jgi:predicted DNA-binding transcriptional regulator AlpA